jgi:hypothetical protein
MAFVGESALYHAVSEKAADGFAMIYASHLNLRNTTGCL